MNDNFDVIITGGSYAGLSAGMALGRALRKVLIIDDGKPCNRQTPYSHNFLTNDGKPPAEISALAYDQVSRYKTVTFIRGLAKSGNKTAGGFEINLATGERFSAKYLLFATGIKDILPAIEGIAECWGISVLHCPYCHGYEIRNEKTGILANGTRAFELARLLSNWTKELVLFTNGSSALSAEQSEQLQSHGINITEKEIEKLEHDKGQLKSIIFKDGSGFPLKALYAPAPFEQSCKIPESLGCSPAEDGYIAIDGSLETTVSGVFAIGDCASGMRTVSNAVAMGTAAGITISKKIIAEEF